MACANPVVLDLRDLGVNSRGVARTLKEVGSRLLAGDPNRYRAVCSAAGLPLLPEADRAQVTVVPPHSQAVFEQLTLPMIAARLRASAVYSLRECGALWGPPLLLHVTEDPEVRWAREPMRLVGPGGGVGREIAPSRLQPLDHEPCFAPRPSGDMHVRHRDRFGTIARIARRECDRGSARS